MVPGVDAQVVQAVLDQGVRGLVIEGFGTGNLPQGEQSVIPLIAEAVRREVPVVVVSQCWRGFVDLGRYEGGAAARKAGAISGGDMTVEAALAKLMIALGRCSTRAQVATFFETNLVDEVTF
jgi:L-asparaginase